MKRQGDIRSERKQRYTQIERKHTRIDINKHAHREYTYIKRERESENRARTRRRGERHGHTWSEER